MPVLKLTKDNIDYLNQYHPGLKYDETKNTVEGILCFKLKYDKIDEVIEDNYAIEIDLNLVSEEGLPIVRETAGKILKIAQLKERHFSDFHLNNDNGEMCMIIPPKVKERYPNGFDLVELLKHIEEHLYWISYFAKYNKAPWPDYGHGPNGYLELYKENKELYSEEVKKYFEINYPDIAKNINYE